MAKRLLAASLVFSAMLTLVVFSTSCFERFQQKSGSADSHAGETAEEHAAHSHEGETAEEHAAHSHEGETAEEHAAHDEGDDHDDHDRGNAGESK